MQRRYSYSTLRPLENALRTVCNKFADKFGSDYLKIMYDWKTIIGAEFAPYTYPVKICSENKKKLLVISANNSSAATMLSFTQNLIIGRINCYFGFKLVDNIKIILK